ncbi:hypothetical protein QE152_g41557, partial [Popillia japonica]
MHNQVQNTSVPASSPSVAVHMQQQQTNSSKRQMQQQRNRSNTPSSNKTVRSTPPNVQHTVQHQQQRQRSSISSDMASQNSVEAARSSSELPAGSSHTSYDCTVQQNLANMHNQVQNTSVPASSPSVA